MGPQRSFIIFYIQNRPFYCSLWIAKPPVAYLLSARPITLTFESLALIMAKIILSVQVAFDTELIRSFNAHTQIKPNNMGRSRLFYPLQYLRKLACILAYIPSRLMLYALERRLMLRNDSRTIIYHKIHH